MNLAVARPLQALVAQSCTLPYRRLAIGRAPANSNESDLADTLQDAILRYGRVQLCATGKHGRAVSRGPGATDKVF
jgi:hypothetical protein